MDFFFLISIAFLLGVPSCFKRQQLHAMSSDAGASIFDDALACLGQRIAFILIRSADKDTNYIVSLHNEVVSVSPC
jgi:hypothetical protein